MKKYVKLLALPVLMSSCSLFNQHKAVEINDAIVRANVEFEQKAKAFGVSFGKAIMAKNYSSLKPERVALAQWVDAKIDTFSKMTDVGGSEEFRKCELEYLQMEKKAMNESFGRFEAFTENTAPEEIQKAVTALTEMASDEQKQLNKLHTLQVAFAEKNHFKLDPNKKVE